MFWLLVKLSNHQEGSSVQTKPNIENHHAMRLDGKPTVQMWCVHRCLLAKARKSNKRGRLKMKHLMKFMAGITVLLLLSGCMDTATRLWNGGPYISKKESQAYDQCFDEVSAQDPEMAKPDLTQAELLEFAYRVRPCMERKGY